MKSSITAQMLTHISGGRTTLAEGFKVTRPDGEIYAFTSHDISDEIDGVLYDAFPGLDLSSIVNSVGTLVGTLELTTLNDGVVFSNADIFNKLWQNSEFELFRYNYSSISDGKIPLMSGRFGDVTIRENDVVVELRDLRQYLQNKVGSISSKTCRYRLGDSRCKVDLSSTDFPYTVNGTITSVTSRSVFRDENQVATADWFGEGSITFLTGNCQGVTAKVRSYTVDGTFTLSLPLFNDVQEGDDYIAVVGCRLRFDEDCVAKFNNPFNFGAEPHRKGYGDVVEIPGA